MSVVSTDSPLSRWRQLAGLGAQLASAELLAAQQAYILEATRQLIGGRVLLWLDENLFRLPGHELPSVFPASPPTPALRRAWRQGRVIRSRQTARVQWLALPIIEQQTRIGALQIYRRQPFDAEDLELLEALSSIIAIGLVIAHRTAVERFRLEQLNLVRQVSAQIANVLDIDELARRVTALIQKTFHYYYVALFTLQPGAASLRFRASASAPRPGREKNIVVDAALGQGLIGLAAQTGQRVLSEDVLNDKRYRFINLLPETRSEVVLPLKIEERILGVLDVQSDRPHAFHPNDLLVLEALADSIARAVEGARLYSDLCRRAEQLSLIAEVSKRATSSLDLRELMRGTAQLIQRRFGYPFVHMFSVHPNRRTIEYEAGSGSRSKHLEGFSFFLDDSQGIIPWVARNGETVLVNDVTRDPRYRPSPLPPRNIRSELCVPLIYDGNVIGLLDIQSQRRNALKEDDRLLFEAVADTIAAAMHNADLYRTEQWRRRVAESLREVAGLLSENVGVEEVLQAILTELNANLPIDISAIWLLGESDLYVAACTNIEVAALEQARRDHPEAASAIMTALFADQPLIRRPTDPLWPPAIAAGFEARSSGIAAPLRIGDRPLGLITLVHHTPGRYGHEAQNMLSTFAGYAAVAIENARLYDQSQEQAYASAALLQAAQAVVSLNELEDILQAIVRLLPILVGVRRALLYHYDAEQDRYLPGHGYGFDDPHRPLLERPLRPQEFPLLDQACKSNRLIVRTLEPDSSPQAWFALPPYPEEEQAAIYADPSPLLILVPLSIKNECYGVLVAEELPAGLRFRARRIEIINGIAQQAVLAIQNDRLQAERVLRERLETEVQLARQIQQSLLSEVLPQPPGWQLAGCWRTAREVGGDFYDVIDLANQRLGLFIADVADKGMPAALFMALTRTLMRAAAQETDSPAAALRRVNELLLPDARQGMFVTAFYAVLNLLTGELTYANAGHNPPLWIRSTSSVQRLTRTGIALGAAEDVHLSERTIVLEEGDSLLLYTDGLTEAFTADGDVFGEERLLQVIQQQVDLPAAARIESIELALDAFLQHASLSDDLTILAIRRVGSGA